jgi:hypothetical protein
VVGYDIGGDDGRHRRQVDDAHAEGFATAQVPALGEPRIGEDGVTVQLDQHAGVGYPGDREFMVAHDRNDAG